MLYLLVDKHFAVWKSIAYCFNN